MVAWILAHTTTFLAYLIGLALWVSLTTDYVKDYTSVEPNLVCLIVALIGTIVSYGCGSPLLGIPFLWYEAIPCILSCVFVSSIAQKGYNELVKKYKDLAGQTNEEGEE